MRTCGSPDGRTLQLVVLVLVATFDADERLLKCAEFMYSNVSMGLVLKCNFFFGFNLDVLLVLEFDGEDAGVGADVCDGGGGGIDSGGVSWWCSSFCS